MQLLITSSGVAREAIRNEITRHFPPERFPTVTYIPTASTVVRDDAYAHIDEANLVKLGYAINRVELADYSRKPEELESALRSGDFLYVQGGNPYWLIKQAQESGFLDVAPRLIHEGMPYIGKSAGAYLLSPEVIVPSWYPKEWRTFGVTDLHGMDLVPFVWAAHYNPEDSAMRDDIARGAEDSPYPVRVITNDQALAVTDTDVELVGLGPEYTPEGRTNLSEDLSDLPRPRLS